MLRMPLKQGEIIQLNNRQYTIESVLGDGATCIVYSAYYNDNMGLVHRVNIKECYPFNINIARAGQVLVWESAEEKESAFTSFRDAYQKLMLWQNNFVANAFDIFEKNQTLYIVMKSDEGVTFDKDSVDNLGDILKTVKLLTYVVSNYHKNGYLHLDIKPSNFLVYPRPSEHIILFDMDTVTAQSDIESGKITNVSYSQNCAAPEQKQGKLNKLCPATDIFAIGAVLFEKIMGRTIESFDLGVFADWHFDGKLFEKVNPKIKRLLRNIFKKTLSANIGRRYKTTDKLISDLAEAINTVSVGVPYIVSDCPTTSANFLGRTKELESIESAFNGSYNSVFLHGFGGIGKSELAKKYAEIHKNEYDAVVFLSYENSIEDLLENIEIFNCERESNESNIKLLKSVLKQNKVLLIIDNFDVEIDQDDYLDKLFRLNADIIITTRTDFSELSIGKSKQLHVANLETKELISLFEKESGITFDELDRSIVNSILKRYNYYTLIVPILAKQLVASGWSINTLNEKTKQGLKAFENTEKIIIQKDGLPYRKTGLDLMRATFRMVNLSDIQKQVLINLYFLRFVTINKEEYRKYLWTESSNCTKHIDAINELLYLGWLKKKYEWQNISDAEIDIHPIIVEMIEIELKPDITKSDMLISYINGYMPWSDLEQELFEGVDDWGTLHIDEISHKLNWFCLFAASIDLHNIRNLSYVVDVMFKLLNGNTYVVELINELYFDKLLSKFQFVFDKPDFDLDVETIFKISNLFETKWTNELSRFYSIGTSRTPKKEIECQDNIKKHFFYAYNLVEKVSDSFRNTAIKTLCKPILQALSFSGSFYKTNVPKSVYLVISQYQDDFSSMFEDFYYRHWEKNEDDFIEDFEDVFLESTKKRTTHKDIVLNKDDEEYYYINKYKLGYDIEEISLELIEDSRFTNREKANIFDDVTNVVFRNIEGVFKWWDEESCRTHEEFLHNTDWKRFLEMSKQYLKFCQTHEFEESDDVNYEIYCAKQRIAIANLMLGEESVPIDNITKDMLERISDITIDEASEWKCYTQFYDIRGMGNISFDLPFVISGIGYYANIYRNLRKNKEILPALIKCANALECKIKDNYEELKDLISCRCWSSDSKDNLRYDVNESEDPMSLMYNWYRNIAEFALNAYLDTGLSNIEYFEIYTEYLEKMRSFTDNSYAFVNYSNRSNREVGFSRFYSQYETIADICETYYVNLYQKGIAFDLFKQRISEDRRLSPLNILSVCKKIAGEEFFEIEICWRDKGGYAAIKEYIKENDWSKIKELLCFENDIYLNTEDFEDELKAFSLNSECDMFRALLYAIKEDKEIFDKYMRGLLNDFKKVFDKDPFQFDRWSFEEFNVLNMKCQGLIGKTFDWMYLIGGQYLALPYLIEYSEYIHDWFKTLPDYSEQMMYCLYKAIAEFAFEDDGVSDILYEYQNKVENMSGKDYLENLHSIIE